MVQIATRAGDRAFARRQQPVWLAVILCMWALDHTGALHVSVDLSRLGFLGDVAGALEGVAEVGITAGAAYAAYRGFSDNRHYRRARETRP
jgi:hypothetical protein